MDDWMIFNLIYITYGALLPLSGTPRVRNLDWQRHLLVIQTVWPFPFYKTSLNMLSKLMTHGSNSTLVTHQTTPVCCYSPTAEVMSKVREILFASHGAGVWTGSFKSKKIRKKFVDGKSNKCVSWIYRIESKTKHELKVLALPRAFSNCPCKSQTGCEDPVSTQLPKTCSS